MEIPSNSRFIPEVVAKPATRELLSRVLGAREAVVNQPEGHGLAGAVGNYLNLEDCSTIGLLAGVDPDQVRVVGNGAGVGAVLTMFDETSGTELKKLAQLTKEINLSTHSEFQDTFVRNLSLHRFNH